MTAPTSPRRAPRRTAGRAAGLLAAGALAATLVPSLGTPSAAVAPAAERPAAAGALVVPDAPPTGRAWIEGLVVDQAGRPLDNVLVEAVDALDPDGPVVASWLTYADPADGPAHGFFRLYVPRGADAIYDLRFSSPDGTADPYETRTLGGAVWVGGGPSAPGVVKDVGTVVMSLVRRADATLDLRARDLGRSGKTSKKLGLSVTSPDVRPVTGRLSIRIDGRSAGTRVLTRSDRGSAVLPLPNLRPGTHTVDVVYAGSPDVLPAELHETVTVVKDKSGKAGKDETGKNKDKTGKGKDKSGKDKGKTGKDEDKGKGKHGAGEDRS